MFERLHADMDVNAGEMLTDKVSLEEMGEQIYQLLLDVASGKESKSKRKASAIMNSYARANWRDDVIEPGQHARKKAVNSSLTYQRAKDRALYSIVLMLIAYLMFHALIRAQK